MLVGEEEAERESAGRIMRLDHGPGGPRRQDTLRRAVKMWDGEPVREEGVDYYEEHIVRSAEALDMRSRAGIVEDVARAAEAALVEAGMQMGVAPGAAQSAGQTDARPAELDHVPATAGTRTAGSSATAGGEGQPAGTRERGSTTSEQVAENGVENNRRAARPGAVVRAWWRRVRKRMEGSIEGRGPRRRSWSDRGGSSIRGAHADPDLGHG